MASRDLDLKFKWQLRRASFTADWCRLVYFAQQKRIPEEALLRDLPFLLEEDLFLTYFPVHEKSAPKSLAEAKQLLTSIVGVTAITCDGFARRFWRRGEETITAFVVDLQNMATVLQLPDSMIKCQLLKGLPSDLARELKLVVDTSSTITTLCQKAEDLLTLQPSAEKSVNVIEDLKLEILKISDQMNALKTDLARSSDKGPRCFRCNRPGHIVRDCRKADDKPRDASCYKCGRRGHFARTCTKNY